MTRFAASYILLLLRGASALSVHLREQLLLLLLLQDSQGNPEPQQ